MKLTARAGRKLSLRHSGAALAAYSRLRNPKLTGELDLQTQRPDLG